MKTVSIEVAKKLHSFGWNIATDWAVYSDPLECEAIMPMGYEPEDNWAFVCWAPCFEEIWTDLPTDFGMDNTGYADVKMLCGDEISYGDCPPGYDASEFGSLSNAAAALWIQIKTGQKI